MYHRNDQELVTVSKARNNRAPGRPESRDEKQDPERPDKDGALSREGVVARAPVASRDSLIPALTVMGIAVWCISVMAIGVNLAGSAWEWAWVLGFGSVIPMALMWQASRLLSPRRGVPSVPSGRDREKELLGALAQSGVLSPLAAAMRTSLTADEAARMLEELAGKGYLQLQVEDGIQSYALRGQDLHRLSRTNPSGSGPGSANGHGPESLDEPLSEREMEVLALLVSGRTNGEIARDLFVTIGTVKSHTSNIYGKLGVKNRAEALARTRSLGLLK